MMRLFVAVHLPAEVRERLGRAQDRLRGARADVSWVKPANLHLTLKFLGETEPKRLERLCAVLAETACAAAPFAVAITGLGTFGGRVPRVVWAGVGAGAEPLGVLARAVERGLARIGFPRETRGFAAHLTLGRVRSATNADALQAALRDAAPDDFGVAPVDRFLLMQSELSPGGSIYTVRQDFPLGTT
jgi:2'-5' RNA ligase